MTKRSAAVYVDGFNLYHGCLKHRPELKWLDLVGLADDLLRDCTVKVVRYYTSRVDNRPNDPDQSSRQDIFLNALKAHCGERLEIAYGTFTTHKRRMLLVTPEPDGRTMAKVYRTEEKGSDVNLGAHLVRDACRGRYEVACVVSNDSDLQTPVDIAVEEGMAVVTVNPHFHNKQPQSLFGTERRKLTRGRLSRNLLPDPVVSTGGQEWRKPGRWKA